MIKLIQQLIQAFHHRMAHLEEGIAQLDSLDREFRWTWRL